MGKKRRVWWVGGGVVVALFAGLVFLLFATGSYSGSIQYMPTHEVESRLRAGMTREQTFEALSISDDGQFKELVRQYTGKSKGSTSPYDDELVTFVSLGGDSLSIIIPQVEYTLEFVEGRLVAVHAYKVHFDEEGGNYLDLLELGRD